MYIYDSKYIVKMFYTFMLFEIPPLCHSIELHMKKRDTVGGCHSNKPLYYFIKQIMEPGHLDKTLL